jgi:hypothetical protein
LKGTHASDYECHEQNLYARGRLQVTIAHLWLKLKGYNDILKGCNIPVATGSLASDLSVCEMRLRFMSDAKQGNLKRLRNRKLFHVWIDHVGFN